MKYKKFRIESEQKNVFNEKKKSFFFDRTKTNLELKDNIKKIRIEKRNMF